MTRFLPAMVISVACVTTVVDSKGWAVLPEPASRPVDFVRDIQPLLEASCVKCHAKGKEKGGFSLETRERFFKGGDTDAGATVGKSGESYVVELLSSSDPNEVMPKKGSKWTPEQIGLLRAWIDQGAHWPEGVTFAKPPPENLQPRVVSLQSRPSVHPLDQLLGNYFAQRGVAFPPTVDDQTFVRRAYLDLVGLLPTPEQSAAFLADVANDKRARLVRTLLSDQRAYADHWLTFWNDLLRNDYKGTGFIDGGRKQITGWLYQALIDNKPYQQFVAELVNPAPPSEGFSRGIIWRGNVNASMLPPMQAAQNVSQVFLGVNLKCASCHDSFVNDWSLSDAYGLAAIYADTPLEMVHCDKPTGKQAAMKFLYSEVGAFEASADKAARLESLAKLMTAPENGRLSRTLVNRLWARLFGRGLVEPLDDMEQPAWSRDLLDWLAQDFVAHGYDVKHTLEVICTSYAYQLAAVAAPGEKEEYVFRGPFARRLSAEQLSDAVSALTEDWAVLPSSLEFDFAASGAVPDLRTPQWIWTEEPVELGPQRSALRLVRAKLADAAKMLAAVQKQAAEATAMDAALTQALARAGEPLAAAQQEASAAMASRATDRHKVIFRKKFSLTALPAKAYATVLASQRMEVQVNGVVAKPVMRDGFRNGRVQLLNLQPLLKAGENLITIDVSSHTEKQMNESERKNFPASAEHLNQKSGVAFYVRCEMPGSEPLQMVSDTSWRVRRNPDGAWNTLALADADWPAASPLASGVSPVDEGPGLEPITRRDFANLPVDLGSALRPAVSVAAQPGGIRAAMLAADPLQVALDRPNREVVVPVRANAATTIQALELTNGATLNSRLQAAALKLTKESDPAAWLEQLFRHALSRPPTEVEKSLSLELLGSKPTQESYADLLWAVVNLPEFQLIR